MCERYFVEFPPQEPVTPEFILEESLALVQPRDVQLHQTLFLIPFDPKPEQPSDKRRLWSSRSKKRVENQAALALRENIRFMVRETKHFGLLLSQLTWVGLLNFAEKRRVLQHEDESLQAAALYIIMLKKEQPSGLTQFIDCLHLTGNHLIGNVIEAKQELLADSFGYGEQYGQCTDGFETSLEEWHGRYLPPKKRKTSADSGFDDTDEDDDDQEIENSLAASGPIVANVRRRFRCNIRPLDAVDVIAIINGKEDSRCKVELCKCGHYHQFPKWKDVNNSNPGRLSEESENVPDQAQHSSLENSNFSRFFVRKVQPESKQRGALQRQGILSPVMQPVEVGSDLTSEMDPDQDEFTQPRRSCPKLRLRFSSVQDYSEHPDNVQMKEDDGDNFNLRSKLPRFLRRLF